MRGKLDNRGEKSLQSILIGTSGYSYPWNQGKPSPFKWYLSQGFSSIEINASFYRFPAESWLKIWLTAPADFSFSIKVHRSITHFTRMKGRSYELWERFKESLSCLERKIDFWLFQMPPDYKYNEQNLQTVANFLDSTGLRNKAVVEFRNASWWKEISEIERIGVVFCSIDAPDLPRNLIVTNGALYLRLHGSKKWYNSIYTEKELDNMLEHIKRLKVDKTAIYLNNDHGMLRNGLYLLKNI
jgi:uncharacterized protein YecE (DUF72 family)